MDGSETDNEESTRAEYRTLANGVLSPRHRRLAQLAAAGTPNAEIAKALDYTDARISTLLNNPYIQQEIQRLQDKVFEDTIQSRLKAMGDQALTNIEKILTDNTNRVKVAEKFAASTWVVEKLDGKAASKIDVGENLLGVFLDRLDAQRSSPRNVSPSGEVIEVKALPSAEPERPKDPLEEWVNDFCANSD